MYVSVYNIGNAVDGFITLINVNGFTNDHISNMMDTTQGCIHGTYSTQLNGSRYSYFISFFTRIIGVNSHGLLRVNLTDFKLSINNNN